MFWVPTMPVPSLYVVYEYSFVRQISVKMSFQNFESKTLRKYRHILIDCVIPEQNQVHGFLAHIVKLSEVSLHYCFQIIQISHFHVVSLVSFGIGEVTINQISQFILSNLNKTRGRMFVTKVVNEEFILISVVISGIQTSASKSSHYRLRNQG